MSDQDRLRALAMIGQSANDEYTRTGGWDARRPEVTELILAVEKALGHLFDRLFEEDHVPDQQDVRHVNVALQGLEKVLQEIVFAYVLEGTATGDFMQQVKDSLAKEMRHGER